MRITQLIILLSISIVLAGCATIYNPATGRDELIWINTASEIAIGKNAAVQIGKKYKLSDDKDAQKRLERIGRRIAKVSDRQDLEYKFKVEQI